MSPAFPFLLARRQLRFRIGTALGALAGVTVAIVLMFTQVGFRNALYDSALQIPANLDGDVFVVSPYYASMTFTPPWFARTLLHEAEAVPGVRDARAMHLFTAQVRLPENGRHLSVTIVAFDPARPVLRLPEIEAALPALGLPRAALLDRLSRHDYRRVAEAIRREGSAEVLLHAPTATLAPVIDLVGTFAMGPSFTIDGMIVTSDLNLYRLAGIPLDRVSVGVVRAEPGTDPVALARMIEERLAGRGRAFARADFLEHERAYYATRTPIGVIFNIGLGVGVIVGMVFVVQALHAMVSANVGEYAVLVALGYRPAFFAALVLLTAAAIVAGTFLPATLIALGVFNLAADATSLRLEMEPADVAAVFGLVLLMAALAAFVAVRRLGRVDPLSLFE